MHFDLERLQGFEIHAAFEVFEVPRVQPAHPRESRRYPEVGFRD
jgi:hypothetical protein